MWSQEEVSTMFTYSTILIGCLEMCLVKQRKISLFQSIALTSFWNPRIPEEQDLGITVLDSDLSDWVKSRKPLTLDRFEIWEGDNQPHKSQMPLPRWVCISSTSFSPSSPRCALITALEGPK